MGPHGNPHRSVTGGQQLCRETPALAAHRQGAAAVVHRPHVRRVRPQGCAVQRKACIAQQPLRLLQAAGPSRAAEHRPHGGPDGLGIIEVRAAVHQKQPVRAEGVGSPQDRPHVARVLDAVQNQVPPPLQTPRQGPLRQSAHRQDPLGGLGWREGAHHVRRHLDLPDLRRETGGRGPLRENHGPDPAAVGQGLLQELGAVTEELALPLPIGPGGRQLADMGAQGIAPAGDDLHRSSLSGCSAGVQPRRRLVPGRRPRWNQYSLAPAGM